MSAAWAVGEAVDILAALLSVDTYEQLVVEQRWSSEQLIERVWQLSHVFLAPSAEAKTAREKA